MSKEAKALPPLSPFFNTGTPVSSPTAHQGRQRTHEHSVGSWPTHVYADVDLSMSFLRLTKSLTEGAKNLLSADTAIHSLLPPLSDHIHLSLSRPLMLSTNSKKDFVNQLRLRAQDHDRFEIAFDSLAVLTNDDNTRHFLVLEINEGASLLRNLVSSIDNLCVTHRLPPYYAEPRFHISLIWWLPSPELDQKEGWKEELEKKLEQTFGDEIRRIAPCEVKAVECKIGQEVINIQLRDSFT
ncbi:hypothetical protein BT69DRAFT_1287006 [Atractiella rhizophila]|nr:hypothetical protein BT69DRAFT_1287006 [Atractiella rhizophila]